MSDEKMYDVVAVEGGKVVSITVWKRVELSRAIRLSRRTPSDEVCAYGLMESGSGYLNRKVTGSEREFEFEEFLNITGKKVRKGVRKEKVVIFVPAVIS